MALDSALAIVTTDGLRGLSVRGIAQRMGYVAGTLYQLFADLDDLIITLNCETLEALLERCRKVSLAGAPEDALERLADVYIAAVNSEPKRWNAVFEYNPPPDRDMPERYVAAVGALLGLIRTVMAPLFGPDEEERKLHEVRVLWSGLYGIATLASSRKASAAGADPRTMVRSLARTYLAGLRAETPRPGRRTK